MAEKKAKKPAVVVGQTIDEVIETVLTLAGDRVGPKTFTLENLARFDSVRYEAIAKRMINRRLVVEEVSTRHYTLTENGEALARALWRARTAEEEVKRLRVEQTVEDVIQGATNHGQASEPDMTVGDLQEALRAAWEVMGEAHREAFMESDPVREILTWL